MQLAGTGGWLPSEAVDHWSVVATALGVAAIVGGVLAAMAAPVRRRLEKRRCVRCGAPTEREQMYCRDHLKQTLDEIRDQTRRRMTERDAPPRRGSSL